MITDSGTIIRTPVAGIPTRSRSAGGVIVMRLGEGQQLVNFTVVAHEDETDEDEIELDENGEVIVTETETTEEVVETIEAETVEEVNEAENKTEE